MHELQWDYSISRSPYGRKLNITNINRNRINRENTTNDDDDDGDNNNNNNNNNNQHQELVSF